MKFFFLFALGSLISGSLNAQNWSPEWYKADDLKSFSEKEILKMISGKYRSEYFIMGHSEPSAIKNYDLEISENGRMTVYLNNIIIKKEKVAVLEYDLQIKNNNGYLTVISVLKKQNDKVLFSINNKMFAGLLYISKSRKEIMFGNGIESDGGPASVWARINE